MERELRKTLIGTAIGSLIGFEFFVNALTYDSTANLLKTHTMQEVKEMYSKASEQTTAKKIGSVLCRPGYELACYMKSKPN